MEENKLSFNIKINISDDITDIELKGNGNKIIFHTCEILRHVADENIKYLGVTVDELIDTIADAAKSQAMADYIENKYLTNKQKKGKLN